ncbi:MAG: ABC transporter permease [Nitriliruptorales bacterium]|nr:ABC transporter permease [Nitriliruptorales bacterium]
MSETLSDLVAFGIIGLQNGAVLAIAASGLVITYATSNVFNMAHGAMGMLMGYVYWQITVDAGVPVLLGIILVAGVIAPLMGAILERVLMRRITNAPIVVSLTVTVGLLVALIGFAQNRYPATDARSVPQIFGNVRFEIAGTSITGHAILSIVLAAVAAFGLYILLNKTRTGIAMRAIVDNRTLLSLHGAPTEYLGMLSWAIGSSLAALAGILIVPLVGLDFILLTLIVINAYAAGMLGRLVSLPRTFLGAIILGLAISYFDYIKSLVPDNIAESGVFVGLGPALPTLFLLGVMLFMPHERLRVGAVEGAARVRIPTRWRTAVFSVVMLVAIGAIVLSSSNVTQIAVGRSLALGAIMLTLVLLTGYGGDVSLGHLTFAGIGALVVFKFPFFGSPWFDSCTGTIDPETGFAASACPTVSLWSLLFAGLMAGIVGLIVAFPALRLRGLYLGLGTLAFARAFDKLVFETGELGFELGGAANFERPNLLGLIDLDGDAAMTMFMAVFFLFYAWVVLELRRGRFGRLLLATRDAPAACGTLGLSITRTRVLTFTLSAAMAGIAGALFAATVVNAGQSDFEMFQNLPLVLLAVAGGITSVTGALIGGFLLGMQTLSGDSFAVVADFLSAVTGTEVEPLGINLFLTGLIAVLLSRQPNGIAGMLFKAFGGVRSWFRWLDGPDDSAPPLVKVPIVEAEEEVTVGAPA